MHAVRWGHQRWAVAGASEVGCSRGIRGGLTSTPAVVPSSTNPLRMNSGTHTHTRCLPAYLPGTPPCP